jgi:large subunit ribosomal protein L4
MEAPKTKEFAGIMANLKLDKKALFVTAEKNENVVKSAGNITGVKTAIVGSMNVYDIVNHGAFVITREAVEKVEEVYE